MLLCENGDQKVRSNAVRLFCCLTEDGDDKEIIDRMGIQSIETLIKIVKSSSDVEEIASAMGVISNLTQSSQLTESLLKAEGLPVISSYALLTLIEAERLPYGSKVLAEANAIHPIIKLLNRPSSGLQEKVLIALERIFRLLDFKQKYGNLAQVPLVDLTQRGNNETKSLAARILGQLNVLHHQSTYF
ncbi:hypothetical protein L1987_57060 [Smallanthus sonchifolius]|uniref:Uncharacterized protein n=1 Tax=Smallanthus sonchifolius TaxID=185202 RepID=A0ACB9DC79_9ASTR|nr:hypothetical protein L1987_57060 [Smallanthus sonchifolius]